jgi:uncharacterized tellurite resistance protein B-like protein
MFEPISHIIREAKKLVRKIPIFRKKITPEEILKNPFACVMIQCGIVDGRLTEEEHSLLVKTLSSAYSFVDDESLLVAIDKAVEKENNNPTPVDTIIRYLMINPPKYTTNSEYDNKVHLVTFAYLVAMEDNYLDRRENDYISYLIDELKIQKEDWEKVKQDAKNNMFKIKEDRHGKIYKNVTEYSLISVDILYKNPIFRLMLYFASLDGDISSEEKETIKTIMCNVFEISRIAIDYNDIFEDSLEKSLREPPQLETEINRIKEEIENDHDIDEYSLIKFIVLMSSKNKPEFYDKGMTQVKNIIGMLRLDEKEAEKEIESVERLIEEQHQLKHMKNKVVYNNINGAYIGHIINETKDGKKWIVRHQGPNEIVFEVKKDHAFIREF